MTNARTYIVPLLAGMIFGLVLACIGKGCKPSSPAKPIVLTDTIRVHDTLRIKEHTKPREVVRIDTIWLQKETTNSTTKDTTKGAADFALVPITQSEYRDTFATDSTRAEVAVLFSGYNARIDSIGINCQATIQPRVERKKSGFGQFVGIGVGAGYGASIVGTQVYAAPQVGISIVYGFGYHW